MSKVTAVLDQIEAEQRQEFGVTEIPDHIPLAELAEQVVRGKVKLSPAQMRMLIELLPFHMPKLSATRLLHEGDFGNRLDRAIARSERAKVVKLIEATATEVED